MPAKNDLDPNASARSKLQRKYNSQPEQVRRRAQRNAARRAAEKLRGAAALKGKDVDHIGAGKKGDLPNKTRVISVNANRSAGGKKAHS
jgi:GrpB-like predicted nucleotidyltransferase (UPF0157 family)